MIVPAVIVVLIGVASLSTSLHFVARPGRQWQLVMGMFMGLAVASCVIGFYLVTMGVK